MCVNVCLIKVPACEEEYSQMLNWYFVWMRLCVFKLLASENDFTHIVQ